MVCYSGFPGSGFMPAHKAQTDYPGHKKSRKQLRLLIIQHSTLAQDALVSLNPMRFPLLIQRV